MKLNHDCIRDILLYLEENTSYTINFISVDDLSSKLNNYNEDVLYYHIKMIDQANLVDRVVWADNRPYRISNPSLEGHEYLANISDDKVWKLIKEHTSKLSSVSLQFLISIAPTFVEKVLFKS